MPKKIYTIAHLGCANCAAKMEHKIKELPQVENAVITFATRKLAVTAQEPDALVDDIQKIISSIEADAVLVTDALDHHEHRCECGHEHHHDDHEHRCECGHSHDHHHHDHTTGNKKRTELIIGGVLFLLGLILTKITPLVSVFVFVAAYLVLGWPILRTAGKNLLKGHVFDENFLMSIATLGAIAIREFPEAVGVMLFFRIGEYFEERAVERSRSQIMEAIDLRPETVTRLEGEYTNVISPEQAQVGDLLLVRPGDRVPLDGIVVSGQSQIDTSPITGEPVPVIVNPGDSVISGCVNTSSQLIIRVEKPLQESMVTRILQAVESAAEGKPKIDRFITRFARIYTPVVVALALATAVIPSLITGEWNYWVYTALSFLVMSCPCALVLSVPLAFFSGIGVGSKQGILFKGGLSMEALAQIKVVALDKTGTITKGEFRVQNVEGGEDVLALCASCEQNSSHPIARSIVEAARERKIPLRTPETLEEIPGCGICAKLDGQQILCGDAGLLERYSVELPESSDCIGNRVLVACNGAYVGSIVVADSIKPGAGDTIQALKSRNIVPVMLTGDTEQSAGLVARQVGIEEVFAKLLPQQKLEKLKQLRERLGKTMFVGDGINDAPVLAGADVGAAMGSGADAAIEAADVVFLRTDVESIVTALDIAAKTRFVAWQNVVFALTVKGAVMVLGLLGFASMWLAVFADSGVAMLCVLNAIRLLYRKN